MVDGSRGLRAVQVTLARFAGPASHPPPTPPLTPLYAHATGYSLRSRCTGGPEDPFPSDYSHARCTLEIIINYPSPFTEQGVVNISKSQVFLKGQRAWGRDIFKSHKTFPSDIQPNPNACNGSTRRLSSQTCAVGTHMVVKSQLTLSPQPRSQVLYQPVPRSTFLLSQELLLFLPSYGCHL
jgi:hypothetical protein